MFEQVTAAPPDSILGLTEAFKKDARPEKLNLSVGVFKDDKGRTPVLKCVKEAERRLLEGESSKTYLSIEGSSEYGRAVRELMFGTDHEIVRSNRACTAQCPGGTGALRVAADFVKKMFPSATAWFSTPTWPNHQGIFKSAGLATASYPYFDAAKNGLDLTGMISTLNTVAAGDVVVLHGCCHNPSGVDPTPDQWTQIADVVLGRGALPLLDFAYQGFGRGLKEDSVGLLTLARPDTEILVASSFSKNFGLYNERVGALTLVAKDATVAETALSQIKTCIRTNYSNPPSHGGAIVSTVLSDATLRQQWDTELAEMRNRINGMRTLFQKTMESRNTGRDWSFITQQTGMFSFSGLKPEQVDALRDKFAIYIVRDGRINVAGMSSETMDRLCDAIVSVL
ncbi:MAG: aspartate/tyrosine/aromatic aminotransferase [Planctomycetia bacterium]|nr:aspartate/tyrosine/aromatic aminotransferase [Planctomycetia bacterium]